MSDDSSAALDSAWATYRHAKQKRHDLHEVVRGLWGPRLDGFDERLGDATGRNA